MSDKKTADRQARAQRRRHARVAPRHRARPGPAQAQQPAVLEDTPAVRGMINKVDYLVQVL
jgi:hypothetical protein